MKTVLVVDDNAPLRQLYRDTLEDEGYRVVEAGDGETVFEVLATEPADLVILDLRMPGTHGLDVLRRLHEAYPRLPVILCSGLKKLFDDFAVWDAGGQIVGMFEKPFDLRILVRHVGLVLGAPAASVSP